MGERYRRQQDQGNFDDHDPTPYKGGYDQAAVYGSVQPASAQTSYPAVRYTADYHDAHSYGQEALPYGGGLRPSQESRHGEGYGGAKPRHDSSGGREEPAYGGAVRPSYHEQKGGESYKHENRYSYEQEGRTEQHGYGKQNSAHGESAYGVGVRPHSNTRPSYGEGRYEERKHDSDEEVSQRRSGPGREKKYEGRKLRNEDSSSEDSSADEAGDRHRSREKKSKRKERQHHQHRRDHD